MSGVLPELGSLGEATPSAEAGTAQVEAVPAEPNEATTYHDRAKSAEAAGDWIEAEQSWRQFLAVNPTLSWPYRGLGAALRRQDRLTDAEEALLPHLERFADDYGLFADYATLAELRRDWAEALTRWNLVRERFPDQYAGFQGAASALRQLGRTDEAKSVLMQAATRFSSDQAYHDLARLAEAAGHWGEAADLWRRYIAINSGMWWSHTALAAALRQQGMLGEAATVLAAARERFPNDLAIFADHARLAEATGDWDAALARWNDIRERFPGDFQGYGGAANALRHLQRPEDAKSVLRQATERLTSANAYHDLGRMAEAAGDYAEAERCWRAYIAIDGGHWWAHCALAAALRHQRAFADAERVLHAAIALFPTEPVPACDYAVVAQARGDLETAIERWMAVLERFPHHHVAYSEAARCLRAAGLQARADALLADAAARFPDSAHFAMEYAWASHGSGDQAEVARRWSGARRRFPGEVTPYVESARAAQALGQAEEANIIIGEARARFPSDRAIAVAWADLPARGLDWPTSVARWAEVRASFPGDSQIVVDSARTLLAAGRADEAEALLRDAVDALPGDLPIARAWAEAAMRRQTWVEAAGRWEVLRQRFPDEAIGYTEGANALRQAHRLPDAEALLMDAARRFPAEPAIALGWANLAVERQDWIEADKRWEDVRIRFPHEVAGWVDGANALVNQSRIDEADALLTLGIDALPTHLGAMVHWALFAGRYKTTEVTLARWERVRAAFPEQTASYALSIFAMLDARRDADAAALIEFALRKFPNNPEIKRAAGEVAARQGDFVAASEQFEQATNQNPGDIASIRRWADVLVALQRNDDARAVLDRALRIWPQDRDFLRRRTMMDIQTGRFEDAVQLWRSVIADADLAADMGYSLAWTIYREGPPPDIAREVFLFVLREPDPGGRHWLPTVSDMLHLRGLKPPLADLAREILNASPDAPRSAPADDVLRSALLYDYSDDDIRRLLRDYAAQGRVALTAFVFCQNYWKPKKGSFERFTTVFEQYIADKWQDLAWISADNCTELLGYLNFAAVYSHETYAMLVGAMRQRLDLAALQSKGLHTIEGAAATIALTARIDPPTAPALLETPRRLKVALCVSGQLRGFQQAVPTWTNFCLDDHDVSVHVHVWQAIGRNWLRIWGFARPNQYLYDALAGPHGLAFLRGRYPRLAAAAAAAAEENDEADVPMLQDVFRTKSVRIEDDRRDRFRSKQNMWKMHYKIEQAHHLALQDGGDFDLMIRMRPDREVKSGSGVDWQAIHAESQDRKVLFTDERYVFTERHTWLADQFAVGTRDVMDGFASVFSDVEACARTGVFPLDTPDHLRPHVNLFYLCFYRGILGKDMPGVQFGRLLDPAMLSVTEILALLRQDLEDRPLDDFDRQFLALTENVAARRVRL